MFRFFWGCSLRPASRTLSFTRKPLPLHPEQPKHFYKTGDPALIFYSKPGKGHGASLMGRLHGEWLAWLCCDATDVCLVRASEIEPLNGAIAGSLCFDSADGCPAWVLLKSAVYMGNGLVTLWFLSSGCSLADADSTWGKPC